MNFLISVFKLAFLNIFREKKRSLLTGLAIFISALLVLVSFSLREGVEIHILKDMWHIQTGHISVVWYDDFIPLRNEPMQIIDPDMHFRYQSYNSDRENFSQLLFHLNSLGDRISYSRVVSHHVTASLNHEKYRLVVRGLESQDRERILQSNPPVQGGFITPGAHQVYLSEKIAKKFQIKPGDSVVFVSDTAYGAKNALSFQVSGFYKQGAPWNNSYAYVDISDALLLFDLEDLSQYVVLYLEDLTFLDQTVKELNRYFVQAKLPFKAQSYKDAGGFFMSIPLASQILFTLIGIVIGFIVILGNYSVLTANLNERKQETGTLRALGFSRINVFLLFSAEILLLSLLSFLLAFLVSLGFVTIFGNAGLRISVEALKYQQGGEAIFPRLDGKSIIFSLLFILGVTTAVSFFPIRQQIKKKIIDILRED